MNLRFTEPDPAQVAVGRLEQTLAPAEDRTAEADAVLQTLSEEARKYRRNRRVQKLVAPLLWALPLAASLGSLMFSSLGHSAYMLFFGILGFYWPLLYASLYLSRRFKKAAHDAVGLDDVRKVGPLVDALAVNDRGMREMAEVENEIIRLLLRLKATDANLLNDGQRKNLNRVFGLYDDSLAWRPPIKTPVYVMVGIVRKHKQKGEAWERRVHLALAVLKAYEQVGDAKALPEVERLASGQGLAARVPEIQEAAKVCLPYLRERVEQEKARQTLLRPSAEPSDSESVLLRPAQNTESDAQQLLRPASP